MRSLSCTQVGQSGFIGGCQCLSTVDRETHPEKAAVCSSKHHGWSRMQAILASGPVRKALQCSARRTGQHYCTAAVAPGNTCTGGAAAWKVTSLKQGTPATCFLTLMLTARAVGVLLNMACMRRNSCSDAGSCCRGRRCPLEASRAATWPPCVPGEPARTAGTELSATEGCACGCCRAGMYRCCCACWACIAATRCCCCCTAACCCCCAVACCCFIG